MNKIKVLAPKPEESFGAIDINEHSSVMVSILCVCFNQASYISETLDSILSQRTEYKFELIVHDDASTDNTAEILLAYQEKYPSIITLILQTENQYSKGIKPFDLCKKKAVGKYIAICEGDDFWLDINKIQKQVEFLESHPEYIISSHDACVIDKSNLLIKESKLPKRRKKDLTSSELSRCKGYLLTVSWVYRNIDIREHHEIRNVKNGDTFFCSVIGEYGKAKYHDDIKPAAYRVHENGVWSNQSNLEKKKSLLNTYYWLYIYHCRIGSKFRIHFLLMLIISSMLLLIKTEKISSIFRTITSILLRK